MQRVLVFRNGSIGNTLMATPALRALRESFPDAAIGVVVDPVGRELLQHCPYVDDLLVYDKRGRDRGARGYLGCVRRLRRFRPTHAVVLKRFFRNGLLSCLSGASVRVGFETNRRAPFLTQTVRYDLGTHIVRLNLDVVRLLGAVSTGGAPEVFLSPDDHDGARSWLCARGLEEGGFICAHYGGVSAGPTFMAPDLFARFLALRAGARRVVLIGSGAREFAGASSVSCALSGCVVGVDLPLRIAIGVLGRSAAFVGFNSGPAHLAAACERPGIVIVPRDVLQKDGARWQPLWAPLRVLEVEREMSRDSWARWMRDAPPLAVQDRQFWGM